MTTFHRIADSVIAFAIGNHPVEWKKYQVWALPRYLEPRGEHPYADPLGPEHYFRAAPGSWEKRGDQDDRDREQDLFLLWYAAVKRGAVLLYRSTTTDGPIRLEPVDPVVLKPASEQHDWRDNWIDTKAGFLRVKLVTHPVASDRRQRVAELIAAEPQFPKHADQETRRRILSQVPGATVRNDWLPAWKADPRHVVQGKHQKVRSRVSSRSRRSRPLG